MSCDSYYYGWEGDVCYKRASLTAPEAKSVQVSAGKRYDMTKGDDAASTGASAT